MATRKSKKVPRAFREAANRRHPLKSTDDLLVISDRDRLAEAVYAAAVETGALAGSV